jgi:hypothetical protein
MFNQKRLVDKNSLLLQGWFTTCLWDNCALRTPYELLIAEDYAFYNYQQLFYDAGPKMFIEVDDTGSLVVRTGEKYLPATRWTGEGMDYKGWKSFEDRQYIDFPINISDDKKTMVISSVDGRFLHLDLISDGYMHSHAVVQSDIVLTKK